MFNIIINSPNKLTYRGIEFRCAIGRNGVTVDKKEGDGATPVGC